jgi:hypothetical protein
VICSILRFQYVSGLTQIAAFFYSGVQIGTWSLIECGASIIAGCLATLRPLLKRLVTTTRDSSILSGCMAQVQRSFKSSAHSDRSTLPRYKNVLSSTKTGRSRDQPISRGVIDEPTLLEFLARPDSEMLALSGGNRDGRASTDPILEQAPEVDGVQFPLPAETRNNKRHTIHTSWTLRDGIANDGRRSERRLTNKY